MSGHCICPSDLKQLVMVEYPGLVKNTDKALGTLGGIDAIEKVFESQKDRLELKFRRSDPLSHPAYGDRTQKKCLVLRITKKPLAQDDIQQNPDDTFDLSVIGKIQTSFKFDTMAEFQWLPMQRTNLVENIKSDQIQNGLTVERTPESLNPSYASILDDILPIKNPFDNMLKNFNPDAPLLLLPAVFSRFDTPREIHQPHPKFRSKEMREEFERQQSLSIIGRTRKKRSTMSYLLNFADPVPDSAPEKLVKERSMLSAHERSLLPKLDKCFVRQKVWSKASLCYELSCSTLDIKYILPLVAFHYLNGPFRTMWVKYGYDPHKDPSSKVLQTLDFRAKNPQDQQEYSRRSIHQYQLPMRKNADNFKNKHQLDLKTIISGASASNQSSHIRYQHHPNFESIDESMMSSKGLPITEAMCKFRKDLVPTARQLSYQLKDIEIDEVQVIVHNNDDREPDECSEKDGWLPEGSIEKIRKIMNKSLIETVDLLAVKLEGV